MIVAAAVRTVLLIMGYLYYSVYSYKMQAINAGLEDEKIIKEYQQSKSIGAKTAEIISWLFTLAVFVLFVTSIFGIKNGDNLQINKNGMLSVVASGSMSNPHIDNTYIPENNLTNQFDVYDIIYIRPAPPQEQLELYDVVVYQNGENLVIHRIVSIEEQNGQKYYFLRGDANNTDDARPVTYDEIIGVYTDFKITALGIFVIFLQSPLGYISMGLVFILECISPIFEKKIGKAIKERLKSIGYITE